MTRQEGPTVQVGAKFRRDEYELLQLMAYVYGSKPGPVMHDIIVAHLRRFADLPEVANYRAAAAELRRVEDAEREAPNVFPIEARRGKA